MFTFAAMAGSFLVSYTRSKAETLGLKGDVGIGSRAERVVVICLGLAVAPWGGLQWAIYVLAATAWITVGQRIWSVRQQLRQAASETIGLRRSTASALCYAASTAVLAPRRKNVFVRMPPALKRRLADDVRESGRSFNDVAVGHLAASVAVPFEPSGRAGHPSP